MFSRFSRDELFSWVWIRPEAFILCDGNDRKMSHFNYQLSHMSVWEPTCNIYSRSITSKWTTCIQLASSTINGFTHTFIPQGTSLPLVYDMGAIGATWTVNGPGRCTTLLSHLRSSCPITDLNVDTAVRSCLFSDSTLCGLSSQAYCTGQQQCFASSGVRLVFIVLSWGEHGMQFEHLSYNHILIYKQNFLSTKPENK